MAAGVGEVEAEASGGQAPLRHARGRMHRHDAMGDNGVGVRPHNLEAVLVDGGPHLRPVVGRVGAAGVVVAEDAERKERAVAAADGHAGVLHLLKVGDAVGGGGAVPKEAEACLVKGARAASAAEDDNDVRGHFAGVENLQQVRWRDAEDELLIGRKLELGAPGAALLVVGRGRAGKRDADKVLGKGLKEALVESLGVERAGVGVERVERRPMAYAAAHGACARVVVCVCACVRVCVCVFVRVRVEKLARRSVQVGCGRRQIF